MARKRMVDPGMWTSETVAALPVAVRYAWISLWSYLDDTGRGKNNPALVKAAVWPLDNLTLDEVRDQIGMLIEGGQLCAYVCCDSNQIHAPQWTVFQKISHPTPTRLCPCPGHEPKASSLHRSELGITPEAFASRSGMSPRSVVEVRSEKRSSGDDRDCEHGVDIRSSCRQCPSSLRACS